MSSDRFQVIAVFLDKQGVVIEANLKESFHCHDMHAVIFYSFAAYISSLEASWFSCKLVELTTCSDYFPVKYRKGPLCFLIMQGADYVKGIWLLFLALK